MYLSYGIMGTYERKKSNQTKKKLSDLTPMKIRGPYIHQKASNSPSTRSLFQVQEREPKISRIIHMLTIHFFSDHTIKMRPLPLF